MIIIFNNVYLWMMRNTRLVVVFLIVSGCLPMVLYILYEEPVRQPPVTREPVVIPRAANTRNLQRQQDLNKACLQYRKKRRVPSPIYSPPVEANVYVEPVHRVFYCPVQKAGSSFWMRTLTAMRSEEYSNPYQMNLHHHNLMYHNSWKKLLSREEAMQVLKTAFSFTFVREPYGRLFSAYVDKIYFPNKIYWPTYTRSIAQSLGKKKSRGYDITFADTVKHLLKTYSEDPQSIDMHFRPMHLLCDPCDVYYKFIGKLETFHEDVEYLLAFFKAKYDDFDIKFEDIEQESTMDDINRHVSMLFYMLDNTKFPDDITKFKILQRGWSDLHIRGYLSKHIPLPFIESQAQTVTREIYLRAITDARAIPADAEAVGRQREEALEQAYRSVPMEDLRKLRTMMRTDCQLFSYNCMPKMLFDRETKHFPDTKHVYLKGL